MKEQVDELIEYIEEHFEQFTPHAEWLIVPPTSDEVIELFPDCQASPVLERNFQFDRFSAWGYYLCMRLTGSNHKFAEMIVMQRPPGSVTDDQFFNSFGMLGDQYPDQQELDRIVAAARAQGYNPSPHDIYLPNVAMSKGDPAAFVSRSEGRAKVKKVLEQRGMTINRSNEVQYDRQDPGSGQRLGEDLISESITEAVQKDPKLANLDRRELREHVIEKHALPPDKG